MKEVIVKIERVLFPRGLLAKATLDDGQVSEVEVDDRVGAMMGGERKGYFRAIIEDDGHLTVGLPIKGQNW